MIADHTGLQHSCTTGSPGAGCIPMRKDVVMMSRSVLGCGNNGLLSSCMIQCWGTQAITACLGDNAVDQLQPDM